MRILLLIGALFAVAAFKVLYGSGGPVIAAKQPPAMSQHADVTSIYRPTPSQNGDVFGSAIAAFDDMVLVGMPALQDFDRDWFGSAYLMDSSSGELLHELVVPDQLPSDIFGRSVALNGKYALVGAPGADNKRGAAYLFDVSTGALIHQFTNPDDVQYGTFGQLVAISDNRVLIGGGHHSVPYGQAFVFDLENRDQAIRLVLPTDGVNDWLGPTVAIGDRYAALKRIYRIYKGRSFTQYAEVIAYDVCTGRQLQTFKNPDDREGYFGTDLSFGDALAIHDDRLLIGARRERLSTPGSAVMYDLTNGAKLMELLGPDEDEAVNFGSSIALNATHATITTDYYNPLNHDMRNETGEVHVFDLQTGEITFSEGFTTPQKRRWARGVAVALTDTHFLVGDRSDETHAPNGGAVYVKPLPPLAGPAPEPAITEAEAATRAASCDAAFAQAAMSISEVTAQGLEIASIAHAEETERRAVIELEQARRDAAKPQESIVKELTINGQVVGYSASIDDAQLSRIQNSLANMTLSQKHYILTVDGFDMQKVIFLLADSDLPASQTTGYALDLANAHSEGDNEAMESILAEIRGHLLN